MGFPPPNQGTGAYRMIKLPSLQNWVSKPNRKNYPHCLPFFFLQIEILDRYPNKPIHSSSRLSSLHTTCALSGAGGKEEEIQS